MPEFWALYGRMFLIGIAVAAPVGAMGVLCIQRTLTHGWRSGMATGLGVATADGIYAALAAFGVSALSSVLVTLQTPLRLVGGVALVVLGVRAALAPTRSCDVETPSALDSGGTARLYASAVGLTLTNPMTIMAFGAIFAGAGLSAQPGAVSAAVATAGVASGSLAWWAVLTAGVALARHAVGNRVLSGVNIASGAIVALFGLIAIGSVFL